MTWSNTAQGSIIKIAKSPAVKRMSSRLRPSKAAYDLLHALGLQANQQVTVFSDGGDTVRTLPEYLHPEADHILDWFHITRKITLLQQCARGLPPPKALATLSDASGDERLDRWLDSVKHYLWHGNSISALERLQDVEDALA